MPTKARTVHEILRDAQRARVRADLTTRGLRVSQQLLDVCEAPESLVTELLDCALDAYVLGTDPCSEILSETSRTGVDVDIRVYPRVGPRVYMSEAVLWLLLAVSARARSTLATRARGGIDSQNPTDEQRILLGDLVPLEFVASRRLTPEAVGMEFMNAPNLMQRHILSIGVSTPPTRRLIDRIAHYHLHMRFLWHRCLVGLTPSDPEAEPWRAEAIRTEVTRYLEVSTQSVRTRISDSIRYSHTYLGEYARSLCDDDADDALAQGIFVAYKRCEFANETPLRSMTYQELKNLDPSATHLCGYTDLFSMRAPPVPGAPVVTRTVRAGIVHQTYEFSQYVVRFAQWGLATAHETAMRNTWYGRPALPVILEVGAGQWAVVDRAMRTSTFVSTSADAIAEWEYRVVTYHRNQLERGVTRPSVHSDMPPAAPAF